MSALIALAVLAAAPAQATPPATSASGAEEEMVCKYQSRTATRFKKKICHPRSVWEQMSENAKRQAAEEFSKPTINTSRE